MSSPKDLPELDLERDMPLTSADLEALARARHLRPLPTEAYLQWLTVMRRSGVERETNSDSDEPFTL